jgi:PAS domain S-box-containing protein
MTAASTDKTMEREMAGSTNLLDSIIEQNPHAMWISDENGTLIRLNQACRDLLHLSDEDVVGKYNVLKDNIVEEQGHMPLVKRVFEMGQTVRFTIEYDSSKLDHLELERTVFRILDVTIAPVKDEDGRVTNAVIMHKDVTEQRQAEEALRSSRQQTELIVDTLPALLAYVDAEQRYLYVNQLYADWYGLSREEIIGKHVSEVLHEATYQKALPAIMAALNGKRVTYENDAVYDVQEQPRTVQATYVPHLDENGQVKAFLAMVEDITERKKAMKEIQDLARFPAENPNPVLRVNREGEILYANEAANPLLDAWDCRESRRLPDEWRAIVSRALTSGSRDQAVAQCDEHTLLLGIAPVSEAGYVNVYGLDVTESRQAEEELRESEFRLRQMADNVGDVFWITEWDSKRTVFASKAYEEIWGRTLQSLYDDPQGWADAIHPEDRARAWDNFTNLGEGESYEEEYRIIRPGGEVRWIRDRGYPMQGEQGKVTRAVGVAQDITDRIHLEQRQAKAEEALRRYVERLRALRAIDGAILAAWSAEAMAKSALQHIRRLVPYQLGSVTTFDLEANEATVLALHTDGETVMTVGARVPIDAPDFESLAQGKVHVVDDIVTGARPTPMEQKLQAAGVRSYVNVPLIADGSLIGTLNLGVEEPGSLAPEHVDIAREVADQLAVAIRQVGLREQVQRHTDELEQRVADRTTELARRTTQLQVAAEVARDATTAHDLDELLNRSVGLVRDRFGFYHAGIFLTDERGEYAVLRAATGDAGRQMLENGHRLKVGEVGIVGHACADGEPRIALDTGADPAHFDNPLLPDTRSEMALPMRVAGHVIGALDVQSADESAFRQDDVEILQVMAEQLAVAIEKTRLFEQVQATLEERLRTVVSNVPIVLFALDRDGVFTLSEGKGLGALGVKSGERVGQSAFELYRDAPEIQDDYRRALAGEVVTSVREQAGAIFDTWWSPLRDASDEITGVIGVAVDVTERERLEEQIQRQQRLAAVGQLAGGIAHDFNNFLMTIVFYAHLLSRDQDGGPDVASIAQTIIGEANRAADLVRQVLDFSRRSAIETKPVDLSSFVEEVTDILQKTLQENIRVVTEMGEGGYVVEIDPTRIQQVIMNLALNARDAMPDGGILRIELSRLTIESTETRLAGISELELTTGDWVCVSVQDTGTGMDEQVQARLFEPFFTTKGPKGNGLGLAQVYGIVKQHGGEIGVETKLGCGTAFRIYLPAYAGNHVQEIEPEETEVIREGSGETILLVENEEKVRDAVQRVLQSLGYRVLPASNGKEALEIFGKAGGVDLVLTDMIMPEMGGRELIQELKRIAPDAKVLVISGYTMQRDIQELKESGLADIIYKPLDVQSLTRAVRRTLDVDKGEE